MATSKIWCKNEPTLNIYHEIVNSKKGSNEKAADGNDCCRKGWCTYRQCSGFHVSLSCGNGKKDPKIKVKGKMCGIIDSYSKK